MLKRLFVFWSFIVIANCCVAQGNLVPNPSFEVYDTCPYDWAQINLLHNWFSRLNSPDFYHKCATSPLQSIPYNVSGFQDTYSQNDSSYIGIINNPYADWAREIIGVKLIDTLKIGRKYFISFLFSPAFDLELTAFRYRCFNNKLGVKFFTDSASLADSLINNFAHLYEDTIVSDTSRWHFFSGSFIADSSYTLMALGVFFTSSQLIFNCQISFPTYSYTYIDNVCVSEDSATCNAYYFSYVPPFKNENEILVYVNDDQSLLHIDVKSSTTNILPLRIFDMLGQVVLQTNLIIGNNVININLSHGIYVLQLNSFVKLIKI